MKKTKLLFVALFLLLLFLVSCGGGSGKTYYTVTFDSAGGSVVNNILVKEGKRATKPTDPTRNKYDFKGWYLDGVEFSFSTPIEHDIILTAKWEKSNFKVVYKNLISGASGSIPQTKTYVSDSVVSITTSTTLSHTDYKFKGWSLTPDGSSLATSFTLEKDTAVYAVWENIIAADCKLNYPDGRIDSTFIFNPYTFLKGDNTKYNKEICMLASFLASGVYGYYNIEIDGLDSPKNCFYLYDKMGFSHGSDKVYIKSSDYEYDRDDLTQYIIAHKECTIDKKSVCFVILSIEGTDGFAQWNSNCDMGSSSTDYYNLAGTTHTDWVNKNRHKGFDVAATRVKAKVEEYLTNTNYKSADKVVMLITGHSRGAGIANIIGAEYETAFGNNEDKKVYTYTFACPCTTDEKDTSFKTVFNIINDDDVVAYIPPENIGFTRYGKTISSDMSSSAMSKYYKDRTGNTYSAAKLQSWKVFFNQITDTRNEVYVFKDVSPVEIDNTLINASGLGKYVRFNESGLVNKVMPNIIYQTIPIIMTGSEAEIGACAYVFTYLAPVCPKYAELILAMAGYVNGVINAHQPICYILLAEK